MHKLTIKLWDTGKRKNTKEARKLFYQRGEEIRSKFTGKQKKKKN